MVHHNLDVLEELKFAILPEKETTLYTKNHEQGIVVKAKKAQTKQKNNQKVHHNILPDWKNKDEMDLSCLLHLQGIIKKYSKYLTLL